MRVDDTAAELIVGVAVADRGAVLRLLRLAVRPGRAQEADRVGLPAHAGAAVPAVLGHRPSWPTRSSPRPRARRRSTVSGPGCSFDPFAAKQATPCGQLLEDLTRARRALRAAASGATLALTRRRRAAAARPSMRGTIATARRGADRRLARRVRLRSRPSRSRRPPTSLGIVLILVRVRLRCRARPSARSRRCCRRCSRRRSATARCRSPTTSAPAISAASCR